MLWTNLLYAIKQFDVEVILLPILAAAAGVAYAVSKEALSWLTVFTRMLIGCTSGYTTYYLLNSRYHDDRDFLLGVTMVAAMVGYQLLTGLNYLLDDPSFLKDWLSKKNRD